MYTTEEVEQLLKEQVKLTLDQHYVTSRIDDSQLAIVEIPNKNRRTGKTTRTIDQAIQNLFKHRVLTISKDYDERSNALDPDAKLHPLNQKSFIKRLIARLSLEHYKQFEIIQDNEVVTTIEIKN